MPQAEKKEIVAGRGSTGTEPPVNPEKKRVSQSTLARIRTRHDFGKAATETIRYTLPDRSERLTEEGLRRWLDLLGISERSYERLVDQKITDSVRLNSHWSLLAWIGSISEMQREAG